MVLSALSEVTMPWRIFWRPVDGSAVSGALVSRGLAARFSFALARRRVRAAAVVGPYSHLDDLPGELLEVL